MRLLGQSHCVVFNAAVSAEKAAACEANLAPKKKQGWRQWGDGCWKSSFDGRMTRRPQRALLAYVRS